MTQQFKNQRSGQERNLWSQFDALQKGMDWGEENITKPQILIDDVYGESHTGSVHLMELTKQASIGVFENQGRQIMNLVNKNITTLKILTPEGSVIKYAAVHENMLYHVGKARVFNSEEECYNAVVGQDIEPGSILVIRYEGLRGSGMPEMLITTEAIVCDDKLNGSTVFITDGRFSGATRGL